MPLAFPRRLQGGWGMIGGLRTNFLRMKARLLPPNFCKQCQPQPPTTPDMPYTYSVGSARMSDPRTPSIDPRV